MGEVFNRGRGVWGEGTHLVLLTYKRERKLIRKTLSFIFFIFYGYQNLKKFKFFWILDLNFPPFSVFLKPPTFKSLLFHFQNQPQKSIFILKGQGQKNFLGSLI